LDDFIEFHFFFPQISKYKKFYAKFERPTTWLFLIFNHLVIQKNEQLVLRVLCMNEFADLLIFEVTLFQLIRAINKAKVINEILALFLPLMTRIQLDPLGLA